VRFDPDLDTHAGSRSTAHSGGDKRPPEGLINEKLSTSMDNYDEQEPEPVGHSFPLTRSMRKRGARHAANSIRIEDLGPLFIKGVDKDYIEGSNTPVVPKPSMDPYQGSSLLRYANGPLDEDGKIPSFPRTGKVSLKESKIKPGYSPAEVDIYAHQTKEKRKKSGNKKMVVRGGPNLDRAMASDVARNARTATTWIPTGSKASLGAITLLLGVMFLPTHVTSMPVSELKLKAPIVHSNPVYLKPLAQNPKVDKLRAYHAMCDKWNQIMDPHPSHKCWEIQKIVDMSKKTVKDGKKSVFYKAQFNDGDRAWFSMDTLRVADPFTVQPCIHPSIL
jgi:hypothetical protein